MDRFNTFSLGEDGDDREKDFWPFLKGRFPTYEDLWRQVIVPLTNRVDARVSRASPDWIDFRAQIPKSFVALSMAHYSVFYFLGRAAKRFERERRSASEYPEDLLYLLDSTGDNFDRFAKAINVIGKDFDTGDIAIRQPKACKPFKEISDYRNAFLHYPVIARRIGSEGEVSIPKWKDERDSPVDTTKDSWLNAKRLGPDEFVETEDLFKRLIDEACSTLDNEWRQILTRIKGQKFQTKFRDLIGHTQDSVPRIPQTLSYQQTLAVSSSASLGMNGTMYIPPQGPEPGNQS
jgi:hypothetical protein